MISCIVIVIKTNITSANKTISPGGNSWVEVDSTAINVMIIEQKKATYAESTCW